MIGAHICLRPAGMGHLNLVSPVDGRSSVVAMRGPFAAGVRGSASTANAFIILPR
jgi:hypothetical protein